MKVLHFVEGDNACTYYRTTQPCEFMKCSGHIHIIIQIYCKLSEKDRDKIYKVIPDMDIIFFNRFLDWQDLIEFANKKNVITIYGTDDYFEFGDKNPFGAIAKYNHYDLRCQNAAQSCDGVIVSTKALQEIFYRYNSNTYVVQNMIDYSMKQWHKKIRGNGKASSRAGERIVIGYYGSPTHYYDLKEAMPAITQLMQEYPNLEFHYGVIPTEGVIYDLNKERGRFKKEVNPNNFMAIKYRNLSKDMPNDRVKYLTYSSIDEFGKVYADFDIAIAPLADTAMNRHKSNLKVIEPGGYNLPVVCSAIRPFTETIKHGVDGFLVNTPDEWYDYLKQLIESKELRNTIGKALGEKVLLNYDIRNRWHDWFYTILTIARISGKPFRNITGKKWSKARILRKNLFG